MAHMDGEVMKRFGANLERLRHGSGMSVAELVERSQTEEAEVRGILGGTKEPRYGTIALLAGALGVEPGELFRGIAWVPPREGVRGHFVVEQTGGG